MKFFANFLLSIYVLLFALGSTHASQRELEWAALDDTTFLDACKDWVDGGGTGSTAYDTHGPIAGWNTAAVTIMKEAFKDAYSFNDDISAWVTSAVTDMSRVSTS
jgi:hypothetical protein